MKKTFDDFVKIADETVFNDERVKDYFNIIQNSYENDKLNIEKLVATLSVNIRDDILYALKAYHDWISQS